MSVGSWPSPSHGIGKLLYIDATYHQRVIAAVLIQAEADANSSNPRLRDEARAWLRNEAHDWLALICTPGRDLDITYRQYLDAVDEAA